MKNKNLCIPFVSFLFISKTLDDSHDVFSMEMFGQAQTVSNKI